MHAVLSGSQALDRPKATGASGSVIISVDEKGIIAYQVNVTKRILAGLPSSGKLRGERLRCLYL